MNAIALHRRQLQSPLGPLYLLATAQALRAISYAPPAGWDNAADTSSQPVLDQAEEELAAYFSEKRQTFSVPLEIAEGTPFQRQVWEALRTIPSGTTQSYRDIAQKIGRPNATRAVGSANGANPLSIVVPCHRVINADGKLGGYAGGLRIKEWLLSHEQAMLAVA